MHKANLEFRKIPSLKYLYEISEDGRIVRNVKSKKQARIYFCRSGSGGWCRVQIGRRSLPVHLLVAECWLGGPCPAGFSIRHIDGDKANNHWRNLRCVPFMDHSSGHGGHKHVPVMMLSKAGEKTFLPSITAAAQWLADALGGRAESYRRRLFGRRRYIKGYSVSYGVEATDDTECRD